MTVAQLIQELSKLPQEANVFSLGYEAGFDQIVRVDVKKLKDTSSSKDSWNGTHQEDNFGATCVVLQTNRR